MLLTRNVPLARLRVYPKGYDGYSTDPGWAWYCTMAEYADGRVPWVDPQGFSYGATDVDTLPVSAFETLQLGNQTITIPRPLVEMQNTRLEKEGGGNLWDQTEGDWETRPAFSGTYDVVHCLDAEGTLTSTFTHPEAPNFAVVFEALGLPEAWNQSTDPPYIAVSWADGVYWLEVWQDGSAHLGDASAGPVVITPIGNTGWRWPAPGKVGETLELLIIHVGGGIAVRANGGAWLWYPADGNCWPDAGGHFAVVHRGGQLSFAFLGVAGPVPALASPSTVLALGSPVMTADRVRAGLPTVQSRQWIPTPITGPDLSPDLVVDNVDHSGTDDVELTATFTWGYAPATGAVPQTGDPALAYHFPYFPELYAAGCYFGPTVGTVGGAGAEIYPTQIEQIDVDLPEEGDTASARLDCWWGVNALGAFADAHEMRFVDLALGWKYDDDSEAVVVVISGYVAETSVAQLTKGRLRVSLGIVDATTRLRQSECDEAWPVMDGWDAEDAALHIVAKLGWPAARCLFASCGGTTLSEGRPEEPLWKAQAGQNGYDFLQRVLRFAEQEVYLGADGVIGARDIMEMNVTAWTIAATGVLDSSPPKIVRRHGFGYTGVEVHGRMADGQALTSYQADLAAEGTPGAASFRGYRRLERFEDSGWVTQAQCDSIAVIMYDTMPQRVGDHAEWRTIGEETAVRRDLVTLTGLSLGIATRLGVVALQHHWGGGKPQCYTDWCAVSYP